MVTVHDTFRYLESDSTSLSFPRATRLSTGRDDGYEDFCAKLLCFSGNEYEMLKDFLGVISYVNTYVKFLFCEGDNNFYPTIEADMLGDIIVRIEIPKSKGSLDSRSVFVSQFPADGSGKLYDCCVHFLNQRVIPAPSGADASSATNAMLVFGRTSFSSVHCCNTFVLFLPILVHQLE